MKMILHHVIQDIAECKNTKMNFQDGYHYNKKLEEYVIGICILEPASYDQISHILSSKQFYDKRNAKMFEAIDEYEKQTQ